MKTVPVFLSVLLASSSLVANAQLLRRPVAPIKPLPLGCGAVVAAADGSKICVVYDALNRIAGAHRVDNPSEKISINWAAPAGQGCSAVSIEFADNGGKYLSENINSCKQKGFLSSFDVKFVAGAKTYDYSIYEFNQPVGYAQLSGVFQESASPGSLVEPTRQEWLGTYNLTDGTMSMVLSVGLQYFVPELEESKYFAPVFQSILVPYDQTSPKGVLMVVAAGSCAGGYNLLTAGAAFAFPWGTIGTGLLLGACAASTYIVGSGQVDAPMPPAQGPGTGGGTDGTNGPPAPVGPPPGGPNPIPKKCDATQPTETNSGPAVCSGGKTP